jgi:phosphoribosyl 1,2-cyclic phosphodiesterase
MMELCVLGSGSQGNSTLIRHGETRVLVDAGFSMKMLQERLLEIGESLQGISALLITHEHVDHIRALPKLMERFPFPVYLTQGTLKALAQHLPAHRAQLIAPGESFQLSDFAIVPFSVPHDAQAPVGFCIECCGRKIVLTTDLGCVTTVVQHYLQHANMILLEANHDVDMLLRGTYPWYLKQRIMGRHGHLSNIAAAEVLESLDWKTAPGIIFMHLSRENNRREIVQDVMKNAIGSRTAFLAIAHQHQNSAIYQCP